MTSSEKKIAFKIEFERILTLLADQIYQSPLALLRENTQNAFDAIRMREALGQEFEPIIEVTVNASQVTVSDNGIGMTSDEIEQNYWYAGRSGKNTDAARAAGVVGTFGIGAMANFGVADHLSVESESALTGARTFSSVLKTELSTDSPGISVKPLPGTGNPGTTVRANLSPGVNLGIQEGRKYLREFVQFVDLPVLFNGDKISGNSHRSALPSDRHAWHEHRENAKLAGLVADEVHIFGMASGELRVLLEGIRSEATASRPGTIVLIQDRSVIRTLRSGFGLANVSVQSGYQWGGVVDLPFLQPTAGREALDSASNQLLQRIVTTLDKGVSRLAANHPESFSNDGFLKWVAATGQFSLCGALEVTPRPGSEPESLSSIVERNGLHYYAGRDQSVIQMYASEDEPLVVLSRRVPRRNCELGYLRGRGVSEVDVSPKVTEEFHAEHLSFSHAALRIRLTRILEEDYFLPVDVRFGSISGGLPLLVTDTGTPAVIYFDPSSTSVKPLLSLYTEDFSSFTPFVKDFVRAIVFPRVSDLVPSSTRKGAESFLRHLRSNREWFEYDIGDQADIEEILEEVQAGRITVAEATRRLTDTDRSFVEVSSAGTGPLASVVQELEGEVEDEAVTDSYEPRPGIDRREYETSARILTGDQSVNGYNSFLSLTDRVQREKGDFFLQPHSTQVVWGGQKVLFVFQHHSKRFGLYYDILCPDLVDGLSGQGSKVTSTILTRNRTFIPIPQEIAKSFLPEADERKRLEVRCDIIYLDDPESLEPLES